MKIVKVVITSTIDEEIGANEPYPNAERIEIQAEAEVVCNHGFTKTINSPGMCSIYSSDQERVAEVKQEQLAELREELLSKGFSSRAITAAINRMKIERVLAALDGEE
jgi:hypothetical protein